jgi:hypothetical protein
MTQITSKPNYGSIIAGEGGVLREEFQDFFDAVELALNTNLLGNQVQLQSYTVLTLPDATVKAGGMIFVSDETGGAVPAFTDGTNWLRTTDRAVVS